MARTDDGETFNCDACSRETPLWDGDNLNGYHDAGVHLCPECENKLPVGTQVDHSAAPDLLTALAMAALAAMTSCSESSAAFSKFSSSSIKSRRAKGLRRS